MQQCREPQPPVPACCFAYAFQTDRRTTSAAPSRGVESVQRSPFDYTPSLRCFRRGYLCSTASGVLWAYPTSPPFFRAGLRYDLPCAARTFISGPGGDLPASVQRRPDIYRVSDRADRSQDLRLAPCFRIAFRPPLNDVGVPDS